MRRLRKLGAALLWLLVALGALVLSATVHLSTQRGRNAGRDTLVEYVDAEMAGQLRIESFTELTPWGGRARNVQLLDPRGQVVLRAEEVVVRLELMELLDGRLRFSHGEVRNGEVVLIPNAEGIPSFIETFAAAQPGDGGPPDPNALVAIVEDLHVENMTVRGDVLGLEGLRVEDLAVHGRLEIDSRREHALDIRIWSGSGRVVAPFEWEMDLDRIVGRVRDDMSEGVEFWVDANTERDQLRARVTYREPEDSARNELDLRIHADPITPETLTQSGLDWAGTFIGPLSGDVRLHGPTDELSIRARLESDGGPLEVRGVLLPTPRVTVVARDVRLDRVIDGAPPIEVSGELDLDVDEAGDVDVVARLQPFTFGELDVPALEVNGRLNVDGIDIDRATTRLACREVAGRTPNASCRTGRLDPFSSIRRNWGT